MTLIEIAADHLTGFLKLTTEPCETIAPWTCTRALLEAASLSVWLLEPGLAVERRVARGFALRFEGLTQQLKWARAEGTVDAQLAVDRIAKVTNDAVGLGFSSVLDRKGRQVGIAERMPSVTELVRDGLDQEVTYRLLSAVAHGHFWAVRQAGFEILGGVTKTADGTPLRSMSKAVNMEGMLYLASCSAMAFGRATWLQGLYSGWESDDLSSILQRLYDRIGFRDEHRFWADGRSGRSR